MNVLVEGTSVEADAGSPLAAVLKNALSGSKMKSLVAVRVKGNGDPVVLDLSSPLPEDAQSLEPISAQSPEGLTILRHSASHVMACAVRHLYPEAKVTIGPAIDTGFYYDFDVPRPFTSDDLAAIEAEMKKIAKSRLPFVRQEMTKEEAIAHFTAQGETYKVELIEAIPDPTVSLYTCGDFTDLCRGPHVPHTGFAASSKLLSVAGAYWHGDEKLPMLSRIYGTAFADDKALAERLKQIEEAKKRDHRKLGKELSLFMFREDVAPGMVFWLPKGMLVRSILEDFWRREHLKRGYSIVQGPQLLRVETWMRSGHYDHYRENMYFTQIDDDMYGIKPMNCVGHMLIYNNALRSYRDLPQRYFELGLVHRHEKSGVLHGLFRVRQFTQDDAHILCTPEQLEGEIVGVIDLINDLMNLFGFTYKVLISTRPENSIGTDEAWELATNALINAVTAKGLAYTINEGDGAFYGPKIDVVLLDCIGREWQCSTIQVDFTLPERFDLVYVGQDGERHRPVMVHRAIMGSLERFIGVLIEQYSGALPVWLAPVQTRLLTVTESANAAAETMCAQLLAKGIRAELDGRNEKLGFKVREAQMAKIQYMLVIGDKEVQAQQCTVRLRNGDNLGLKSVDEIAQRIKDDAEEPFKRGGMCYSFA
ncbi:MAG: threonine--tRNA ligase [Desulfovibrionaceae bacterium]|nr:threonine--tRNA ligase [Desulfovibrionaceae bacterium]